MKILIVRTFPNIIDPHKYNVQEIGLARALIRKGYKCGIVLYNGKMKDEVELIPVSCDCGERNIVIYKLHGFNIFKNGFFPSLNQIVKEYDVIQVHEYDQITSWMYYAWSKKPVVIYHGPYFHEFNKGYNFKCQVFDRVFLKLKHNKKAICMTKSSLAENFLKSKGFQDVQTVGVGLDIENFCLKKDPDDYIGVSEDTFNLLYIGKIEERRNVFFLLDIMKEMIERHHDVRCIIIGNGEEEYQQKFFEEANPLIQSDKLKYYPSMKQSELANVYRNANVMLFTSYYEIFGMVLLEALYFGVPIISSKNGGADMLLTNDRNGYIIDNWDKNVWINKIENLYYNKQKYFSLVENIEKSDKSDIFWDSVSKRFIAEYQKALLKGNDNE